MQGNCNTHALATAGPVTQSTCSTCCTLCTIVTGLTDGAWASLCGGQSPRLSTHDHWQGSLRINGMALQGHQKIPYNDKRVKICYRYEIGVENNMKNKIGESKGCPWTGCDVKPVTEDRG